MTASPPVTTTIEVFDRAREVASSPEDRSLMARFDDDLVWLARQGVVVKRHRRDDAPQAFAACAAVTRLLADSGDEALPAVVVDGEVVIWGEYPTRDRLAQVAGIEMSPGASSESGALDDRTATLIALAAAVVADAESALREHHERAVAMGISTDEMIEALNVALHVKGQAANATVRLAQGLVLPASAQGGCCGGKTAGGGCGCG